MKLCIFLLLATLAGGYLVLVLHKRLSIVRLGRPVNRNDRPLERWKYFLAQTVKQKKIRNAPVFGLFHIFLSWGFPVLLCSSIGMLMAGLCQRQLSFFEHPLYLFVRDTAIFLVIIGVIGCLIRRSIRKPKWLSTNVMAYTILLLIFVIAISEPLFNAFYIMGTGNVLESASWLTGATMILFHKLKIGSSPGWQEIFWWLHFLGIFSFCVIIPNSKHLHLILAPFNTYWHTLTPIGTLSAVDFSPNKSTPLKGEAQTYGVNKLEDFTWKQLLDVFSCVKCGRCNNHCPAQQSNEETKPKKLNGRLRKHLENATGKTIGQMFKPEAIWGCTTCGGCETACPISCEPISKYIDMRRYFVSSKNNLPERIRQVFAGCEDEGAPWGLKRERSPGYGRLKELNLPAIKEDPQAEYLYYIGCAAYYEESALQTAIAFVRILNKAGVRFAVLGEDELCCGETVRRMGNEALFQSTAQKNVTLWAKWGVKKIVTTCPHCFNTLQNEYGQFGGNYEVIPHIALLDQLIREGKIRSVRGQTAVVTYHDSCFFGRHNGFFQQPRNVLKAVPDASLAEPVRTGENSFCCGAGGGRFWLKGEFPNAISPNRAEEILATGAKVLCTSCPYCKLTLDAELKGLASQGGMKTLDIAEFLADSL